VLSEVITSSFSLIQEQLRLRQIGVKVEMPDEEVVVIGNAIQLEQVFLNLLTNARDAMNEQEEKQIIITCTTNDDLVEIRVRDTGSGIDPAIAPRIFDPFFTTKEVGAGTGLGLSITYSIIQEHQGNIQLENHPGKGSLFLIQLPRASTDQERIFTS